MIGDTNLFLVSSDSYLCAEAEIMIAESWARGRKCGWEAMLLMFIYGIQHLGLKEYMVKISYDNDTSLNMFRNMGFEEYSKSETFQEVTMIKMVDPKWIAWLNASLGNFEIKKLTE